MVNNFEIEKQQMNDKFNADFKKLQDEMAAKMKKFLAS